MAEPQALARARLEPAERQGLSAGDVLKRSLYRLGRLLQARRSGLPAHAVFPGVPDDRFQARLAVYQHLGRSAAKRRVLDLGCGTGFGAQALISAGARGVVGVDADRRCLAYARRTFVHPALELLALPQDAALPDQVTLGRFDLALADADWPAWEHRRAELLAWISASLERGGELVIALIGSGAEPRRLEDRVEAWREALASHFLHCRRLLRLPPPGYEPDFESSAPARARAQEYRFVAIPAHSELAPPQEALGVLLVAGVPRHLAPPEPLRLHVGSGPERLEGWLNIDLERSAGVDLVLDVREGLALHDVEAVFAEHFLEHLTVGEALDFLAEVHACLRPEGRLRLSTPNLDWVLDSHGRHGSEQHDVRSALTLNRSFYSWGHRFLWSRELLERALRATGFDALRWPAYGQSEWQGFRGLERHEPYPDTEALPHVLVVEATKAAPAPEALASLRVLLREELLRYQEREWVE